MEYPSYNVNTPQWREITVGSHLPMELGKLAEIARNLWWTWNDDAKSMYCDLDPELWEETEQNPILFLERMNYEKLVTLAHDEFFIRKMNTVYTAFKEYINVVPDHKRPSVAYFSMEYGLDKVLKIYSGGLGILAGDYLKEASDSNVDLCAVGLLYRYGYFDQSLSMDGQQIANYEAQNFGQLPIEKVMQPDGKQLVIHIPYAGGMMTLKALGIEKDVYHCNEGHAALINIQRLCDYIAGGLDFGQAMELVRASSLYTVHTPVPAGHDYFDEGLFNKYMKGYPDKLGITWNNLMDLGRHNPGDKGERFCMSVFACKTSQEVNGVSLLHKTVSQEMFAPIWKGYFPEENHVGYVTNGVHFPTWCATEWEKLFKDNFDESFIHDQSNQKIWEAVYDIPDEEIWNTRLKLKTKLIDYIKRKCSKDWLRSQIDPSLTISIFEKFNPNALLIGFGRRFATYKRAHLLFTDIDRLAKIVNNPKYPVQFIFTGKAHPSDGAGQGLIRQIVEISRRPEFLGKIIFLENYDMDLARHLIAGVDIWLNTPTRLAEASGTSGEKALMNGVLNFSVLDGWWYEGYCKDAGWALTDKSIYQNEQYQNQLDAEAIYYLLEHDILPAYYEHGDKEYSENWIKYIKNSIAQIAPRFTMKRQLDDYYEKFYIKLSEHFHILSADNNAKAKMISDWKTAVRNRWDSIEIKSIKAGNGLDATIEAGKEYEVTVVVDEKGLDDAIGIELVIIQHESGQDHIYEVIPLPLVSKDGNLYTFKGTSQIFNAGSFKQAFRMYPKNNLLPHRQDFCYVRWF